MTKVEPHLKLDACSKLTVVYIKIGTNQQATKKHTAVSRYLYKIRVNTNANTTQMNLGVL